MSKYIDADRLKAEIKKKRNKIVAEALDPDASIERVASAKYKKDALSDAISIIDSLQQEQPEVDLEKEIKNERTKLLDAFGPMNGEQCLALRNFARHFAEWGATHLNARKEE